MYLYVLYIELSSRNYYYYSLDYSIDLYKLNLYFDRHYKSHRTKFLKVFLIRKNLNIT